MGAFEHFPYTNFQDLNLNWMLGEIKILTNEITELQKAFDEELEETIISYINEHLSQFVLGAMYDEPNKKIKLQPAEILADGDHVYNATNEQILVLEGR